MSNIEVEELSDSDLEGASGGALAASLCCCSTTGGHCSNAQTNPTTPGTGVISAG